MSGTSRQDEFEAIGAVDRLNDCVLRLVKDEGSAQIYFEPTKVPGGNASSVATELSLSGLAPFGILSEWP